MSSAQANSKRPSWSTIIIILIWPIFSLQGCDKLSRTSTAYGRVTEIGGSGVDSIDVVFVAYKNISGQKGLLRITTDKDGNYSGTVDVPKGYGNLDVAIPSGGNPKFTRVYRDYDVYLNGKKINYCCPAEIGGKTQYDFKMYK
ncbi:MAG: hypothetical protein ABIN80_11120 [Dyadobacter sp.]|uniref:hypothetical protein n=1 Tax=Dyadobacter sp. TaxID=1914288 RepID=UPI0032658AB4